MRRDNYFWAVLLILGGGLLLLSNLNILDINAWKLLWPLFLIVAGIWLLWGSFFGQPSREVEEVTIPLEGAERARVHIQHGAGRLHLVGDAPAPGELLAGTFGGGLAYSTKSDGHTLDLKLKPDQHGMPFLVWGPSSGFRWNFSLSREIPLELELETGAGETQLDLRDLRVTHLHLQTGASSSTVTMPGAAGHTRAKIEAGAAAVTVTIPQGVAARIQTQSGLAAVNIDRDRFPRQGKVYQSPDYETAANKLDLEIETGVSSVSVY